MKNLLDYCEIQPVNRFFVRSFLAYAYWHIKLFSTHRWIDSGETTISLRAVINGDEKSANAAIEYRKLNAGEIIQSW